MALSASELHTRGVAAANARRFAAARRALAAASARTDDDDLRARIDGTAAYVLAQTGRPADAERLSRDALTRPGLGAGTVALLSGQLGTLLLHAGRLDEAEAMLTVAVETTVDASAEGVELANLLMNRAVVRMQRHELDACVADLDRAVEIYDAAGDEEPLAEARHNRGYAALLGGDLVTALALMTESRPALAAISALAAAIGDQDRAEVLIDAGLTSEAEQLLAEVAVQFGAQRMRQARAEAEFHLARSLLRHDPESAARSAASAGKRFDALGNRGWAARADAVRLEARARLGRTPSAAEFTATSSALRRAGFRTEATALALTSRLSSGGRVPRLSTEATTPLRLREHEVRAARALAARRDRDASRIAAEGLELLSRWQSTFGALDLQVSISMHGSDLLGTGLAAAARIGDPDLLFDWSEHARHLSQRVAPVRPPHDPELAADLARLRMLRADLAGHDWTADAAVRALRDRVRERQWTATGAADAGRPLSLAETRARLPEGAALLAYVFTGAALQCVVVTATSARIVPLDWPRVRAGLDGLRADLDMAALTRGGAMGPLVERSLDERLRRLDDALLAPARAVTGNASRLAVTAPGVLAGLPWAMLPTLAGVPFTLATSVSRWLSDREDADAAAPTRAGFAAGPRVPRAEEELRRAASAWAPADVLPASAASVDDVIALAGRSDVLHLAAHGRHSADNPLFAGLELADGALFGYDVDLIPRVPSTVVLSACELGRSSVRWGEEALGMTRVWLHAGTRCVIAAPVMVADAVAGELLAAVHAGLARGAAPADALAAASVSTGLRAPFHCHGAGF